MFELEERFINAVKDYEIKYKKLPKYCIVAHNIYDVLDYTCIKSVVPNLHINKTSELLSYIIEDNCIELADLGAKNVLTVNLRFNEEVYNPKTDLQRILKNLMDNYKNIVHRYPKVCELSTYDFILLRDSLPKGTGVNCPFTFGGCANIIYNSQLPNNHILLDGYQYVIDKNGSVTEIEPWNVTNNKTPELIPLIIKAIDEYTSRGHNPLYFRLNPQDCMSLKEEIKWTLPTNVTFAYKDGQHDVAMIAGVHLGDSSPRIKLGTILIGNDTFNLYNTKPPTYKRSIMDAIIKFLNENPLEKPGINGCYINSNDFSKLKEEMSTYIQDEKTFVGIATGQDSYVKLNGTWISIGERCRESCIIVNERIYSLYSLYELNNKVDYIRKWEKIISDLKLHNDYLFNDKPIPMQKPAVEGVLNTSKSETNKIKGDTSCSSLLWRKF